MKTETKISETIIAPYDLQQSVTLRQYFLEILDELWREGERFSGKRPLGDSGWQTHIGQQLVKAGHIPGCFDEDEYEFEWSDVNEAIAKAFEEMGTTRVPEMVMITAARLLELEAKEASHEER